MKKSFQVSAVGGEEGGEFVDARRRGVVEKDAAGIRGIRVVKVRVRQRDGVKKELGIEVGGVGSLLSRSEEEEEGASGRDVLARNLEGVLLVEASLNWEIEIEVEAVGLDAERVQRRPSLCDVETRC